MDKIKEIADKADMIVNGYAFTRENKPMKENKKLEASNTELVAEIL